MHCCVLLLRICLLFPPQVMMFSQDQEHTTVLSVLESKQLATDPQE